jgi:preprotein translocase subunit SecD
VIDLEDELRGGLSDAANAVTISPEAWASYERRATRRSSGNSRLKVSLSIAAIAGATAAVVIGVIVLTSNGTSGNQTISPTERTVTLTPSTRIDAGELASAAKVIDRRLVGIGVRGATVARSGHVLVVHLPAAALPSLGTIAGTRGTLRFRQALSLSSGMPAPGTTSPVNPSPQSAESPTLTKRFEHTYQAWDCTKPATRNPTEGQDLAADYTVACSSDGTQKYLLAPTAVDGSQVTSASAGIGQTSQWVVNLTFSRSAAKAWQRVTAKAYNVNKGQQSTTCSPPVGCNAIAIVLDGVVASAPNIISAGGIFGGQAEISGGFTQRSATALADDVKYGALATTFHVSSP